MGAIWKGNRAALMLNWEAAYARKELIWAITNIQRSVVALLFLSTVVRVKNVIGGVRSREVANAGRSSSSPKDIPQLNNFPCWGIAHHFYN
jgi:hypothetical protein